MYSTCISSLHLLPSSILLLFITSIPQSNINQGKQGKQGTHDKMPSRHSRITGALLGVHAGDSLGATLEFKSHAQIAKAYPNGLRKIIGGGPFSWPAGHATDDTDMTRAVLLAYRDAIAIAHAAGGSSTGAGAEQKTVTYRAAEYFLHWYRGQWPNTSTTKQGLPPKDIGMATRAGIENFKRGRDPSTSGAGQGRKGNGSLMRCIPTALFQPDHHLLVKESIAISAITHDDEDCVTACAAYNAIVAALVAGANAHYAVAAGEAVAITLEKGRQGAVSRALRRGRKTDLAHLAQHGPPKAHYPGYCSGHVLESLSLGVAAVLDGRRSLEDVLVDVVRVGKDTDTNGAVAGGLLGARDGEEGIPRAWVEVLQFGGEFRDVARAIWTVQEG